MEEKRYTFAKRYLQVKSKVSYEIWCKEGRSKKVTITDAEDGDLYIFMRRDFLYSHSDTTITMCHLLFRGENLESLEIEESDFLPNFTTKAEFIEHKEDNKEYEEQNEKDKEEINKTFEEHKKSNEEAFKQNKTEHIEIKNLIGKYHAFDTTWSKLKTLRDDKQLIAGKWYCITDYTCVTNSTKTTIKSGGHSFSILVLATSENTLSETAFATKPPKERETTITINGHTMAFYGENPNYTYFQYCNLDAWELKYCLDNDQTRFPWCGSDDDGGKGVIWYMKDEYNNEAYYDFKNIMEIRYEITASTNNEFNFNFKNFTSETSRDGWTIDTTNLFYFYTFSYCIETTLTQDSILDLSVQDGLNRCSFGNNKLMHKSGINLNCFLVINGKSDEIKNKITPAICNINSNELGISSYSNTFNCIHIEYMLGPRHEEIFYFVKTSDNKFGGGNYCNTFGGYCFNNIFGSENFNNAFGTTCNNNTFGSSNSYNTFNMLFQYNSFGNQNTYNSFNSSTFNISFGNCNKNIVADNASNNYSFGNGNSNILLNGNCKYISFGNYNIGISLNNGSSSISFGNNNKDIAINGDYISFGNGNSYWKVGETTACYGCFIGNYIQGTSSSYRTIDGQTRQQYWS